MFPSYLSHIFVTLVGPGNKAPPGLLSEEAASWYKDGGPHPKAPRPGKQIPTHTHGGERTNQTTVPF